VGATAANAGIAKATPDATVSANNEALRLLGIVLMFECMVAKLTAW
jgi:hypothetical protein